MLPGVLGEIQRENLFSEFFFFFFLSVPVACGSSRDRVQTCAAAVTTQDTYLALGLNCKYKS